MLFLDEFYPAVLGAAFVRAVRGDGLVGALADGRQAGLCDALFNQGGYDGFGPLLTQRVMPGFSFINLATRFISTMDSGLRSALPVSKVMA